MRFRCLVMFICACAASASAEAALVTHYNFNGYDGNASTIAASSGGGSLTLEYDAVGAPATYSPWPASQLSNPGGTTLNAVAGDAAGTALGLGNTGSTTGGRRLTMAFSSLGFTDLQLSYAAGGSNSAYNIADISYSINGMAFQSSGVSFDPSVAGTYKLLTQDLSSLSDLNNQSSVLLRLTLSGAGNSNQVLEIDNLRIDGTEAVPEAHALAMAVTALLLFGFFGGKRRITNGLNSRPT